MTDLLIGKVITSDPKRYTKLFLYLKAGMTENEALQAVYGIRREAHISRGALAHGFCRANPGLAPRG